MHTPDLREWLLTNGLGSFASGTISDARTRTYHGWFVVALHPPQQRTLLLSHLEASLEIAGQVFALGTNFWLGEKVDPWGYQFLQTFQRNPVPTWIWGTEEWQLSRQLVMPDGREGASPAVPNAHGETGHPSLVIGHSSLAGDEGQRTKDDSKSKISQRLLIQYRYSGKEAAVLRLRPIIGDRDFHHPQKQSSELAFSQIVGTHEVFLQGFHGNKPGTPWQLRWSQGHYQPDGTWYWNYHYPEEASRGLDCSEDLYSPGYLSVLMSPDETVILEASLGLPQGATPDLEAALAEAIRLPQPVTDTANSKTGHAAFRDALTQIGEQFIVQAAANYSCILAGYHWFGPTTRDLLLCIPGFLLTSQRFTQARQLLNQLGTFCYQGLLPDSLPNAEASPVYTNIDCALWWMEMLGLYLEATQDWQFLQEQYSVVKRIYKSFTGGTLYGIRIDASDGLITWDEPRVPLTWMNAQVSGRPITPRQGKPVEINALWYSALCWASQWATQLGANPTVGNDDPLSNQARRYTQQAKQVKSSLGKFWNAHQGYLFDRIEPDDRCDLTIRPNAVLALSLKHCAFTAEQAQQILQVARDRLLTPYGLRTLDPADFAYRGHYAGDPYHRDLAYHQGTVWTWLLGPFLRAWQRFFPGSPFPIDGFLIMEHFHHQGCLEAVSELFDGDPPHTPKGAIAHALATAELIRLWQTEDDEFKFYK
jgi:4-alpha-glucanotransferase